MCAFISKGSLLTALERLDPTAYKGKDHMITDDSFIFQMSNGFEDALNLLATRSTTRPVLLDLGGTRNSFWKWRFKISDMKPDFFSTRLLYQLDHKPCTRLGPQDGVLIHNP